MSFGTRLRQARNEKHLTQNQVAVKLGIDFTTISKYENDRSQPDNEILKELAGIYEVSLDWLLKGDRVEEPATGNRIFANGTVEELTEEETKHLLDSLEMFRLLRAKREKEQKRDDLYRSK
jgi:transcriptional regulator with XRE-family HTH domain